MRSIVCATGLVLLLTAPCYAQFSFELVAEGERIATLELDTDFRAEVENIVDFELLSRGKELFGDLQIEFERTEGLFNVVGNQLKASNQIAFAYDDLDDGYFRISNFGASRVQGGVPNVDVLGTWFVVPEPSSFAMSGFALIGWMLVRRRTR